MSKTVNESIKCPFCGKADIHFIYSPSSVKFRKGTYGGGRMGAISTQESTIIIEGKCPNCGKSKKEIQIKLAGEGEASPEERLKRLRDSGLPTRIED